MYWQLAKMSTLFSTKSWNKPVDEPLSTEPHSWLAGFEKSRVQPSFYANKLDKIITTVLKYFVGT